MAYSEIPFETGKFVLLAYLRRIYRNGEVSVIQFEHSGNVAHSRSKKSVTSGTTIPTKFQLYRALFLTYVFHINASVIRDWFNQKESIVSKFSCPSSYLEAANEISSSGSVQTKLEPCNSNKKHLNGMVQLGKVAGKAAARKRCLHREIIIEREI